MSDLDFFVAQGKNSDPEWNTTERTEELSVDNDDAFDISLFAKVEEGMITTRGPPLDSLVHVAKSVPAAAASA
jgi:hypothetical protein